MSVNANYSTVWLMLKTSGEIKIVLVKLIWLTVLKDQLIVVLVQLPELVKLYTKPFMMLLVLMILPMMLNST